MIIKYVLTPFLLPHLILYIFIKNKKVIDADAHRFFLEYWGEPGNLSNINLLIKVLLFCPEFRNIFYKRVSKLATKFRIRFLLEILFPSYKFLSIGTSAEKIGKGFFVQHGNSTIIHAEKIGDSFWVNQNVTVGDNGKGIPTIGDNVRIGTGAVVLGPISIGNNVIIGANATVVKNVPDNCTVIPSPTFIIKKNGDRTYEKL